MTTHAAQVLETGFAALVLLAACSAGPRVQVRPEAGAAVVDVTVELAQTAVERARGLRGHAPLANDEGLLIELPQATQVCIVNDGVSFAIDAIYVDADRRVIAIAGTIAAGDPTARCQDGVQDVLELAAGGASRAAPGDVVTIQL
jgi:uncharacterized membrane protein (UPF0127 family)